MWSSALEMYHDIFGHENFSMCQLGAGNCGMRFAVGSEGRKLPFLLQTAAAALNIPNGSPSS